MQANSFTAQMSCLQLCFHGASEGFHYAIAPTQEWLHSQREKMSQVNENSTEIRLRTAINKKHEKAFPSKGPLYPFICICFSG